MKYELKIEFFIDHDELDESSKEESFVLGYEVGQFVGFLRQGIPFEMVVHASNTMRFYEVARQMGNTVIISPEGEGWVKAKVDWK